MPWVTMPRSFTKAKGGTRDYGVMSASAISYITGAAHKSPHFGWRADRPCGEGDGEVRHLLRRCLGGGLCATGSSREQRGLGACRCINTGCALCPAIVRGVRRVWKTLARICNPCGSQVVRLEMALFICSWCRASVAGLWTPPSFACTPPPVSHYCCSPLPSCLRALLL